MVTAAVTPSTPTPGVIEDLACAAIAELVAFWAALPVDPIDPGTARSELLSLVPSLQHLADAAGA